MKINNKTRLRVIKFGFLKANSEVKLSSSYYYLFMVKQQTSLLVSIGRVVMGKKTNEFSGQQEENAVLLLITCHRLTD